MTTLSTTIGPASMRTPDTSAPVARKPRSLPGLPHAVLRKPAGRARAACRRLLPRIQNVVTPRGPAGETWIRLYRPAGASGPLPVVIYVRGDDAPFSDLATHLQAYRLATDVHAAVVVVDATLAPSGGFPAAAEETYVAAVWVAEHGDEYGLDARRIALTSDPSGADLGNEVMLMAKMRGDVRLVAHVRGSSQATAALRAALAA
ncbi:alpha/beta hydrolase fold domain-containing protein [Dactylosporangium sp. NPDC005572]|uniref:alpha/beta hydrolase n=1 Tax=Dactylosporangium sp. NPDC005572 TaxID=3156889 RepID=UPI0033AE1E85